MQATLSDILKRLGIPVFLIPDVIITITPSGEMADLYFLQAPTLTLIFIVGKQR